MNSFEPECNCSMEHHQCPFCQHEFPSKCPKCHKQCHKKCHKCCHCGHDFWDVEWECPKCNHKCKHDCC